MRPQHVIITGASGFIGTHLTDTFADAGWEVTALSRNSSLTRSDKNVVHSAYTLGDRFAYSGDVLIHCAYDSSAHLTESFNVDASARLFHEARRAGISKIVFLSSLSASAHAQSNYGKQKYLTEGHLDFSRDLAIRPGLVVGEGGLFAAMRASLSRFRIAPVFNGGGQPVYVIAISDLCGAILRLVVSDAQGVFTIAAPTAMPLSTLYKRIAEHDGVRIRLLSLPLAATLWMLSRAERVGLKCPISAESIRGIRNLKYLEIPEYREFGIAPMTAEAAIMNLEIQRS